MAIINYHYAWHAAGRGRRTLEGGRDSRGASEISHTTSAGQPASPNYQTASAGQSGPPKNIRACHGPTLVGRPINFLCDGPRPGPTRQIFRGWTAARPGPSNFQRMGRGPAQPITFSKRHGPARPGSSFFRSLGRPRPGPSHSSESHETRALYGPARQLRGPARGFDGPAHVLFRTKTWMYTLR